MCLEPRVGRGRMLRGVDKCSNLSLFFLNSFVFFYFKFVRVRWKTNIYGKWKYGNLEKKFGRFHGSHSCSSNLELCTFLVHLSGFTFFENGKHIMRFLNVLGNCRRCLTRRSGGFNNHHHQIWLVFMAITYSKLKIKMYRNHGSLRFLLFFPFFL